MSAVERDLGWLHIVLVGRKRFGKKKWLNVKLFARTVIVCARLTEGRAVLFFLHDIT